MECVICKRELNGTANKKYCNRCLPLARRSVGNVAERVAALKEAYDRKTDQFLCGYTRLVLKTSKFDNGDPFYLTFDHVNTKKSSKIVVCGAYINDVKSDTTEEEFKKNIIAIARHFLSEGHAGKSIKLYQKKLSEGELKLSKFKRVNTSG
jgi:hypothetical protein